MSERALKLHSSILDISEQASVKNAYNFLDLTERASAKNNFNFTGTKLANRIVPYLSERASEREKLTQMSWILVSERAWKIHTTVPDLSERASVKITLKYPGP